MRAVLAHLAEADRGYTHIVSTLRDQETSNEASVATPISVTEALQQLNTEKQALITAVQGVDEETFYRLRHALHQEYSVLSALRDAALHKREHLRQIRATLLAS